MEEPEDLLADNAGSSRDWAESPVYLLVSGSDISDFGNGRSHLLERVY